MFTHRKYYLVISLGLFTALIFLFNYHINNIAVPIEWQAPINFLAFGWMFLTILFSHFNKEFKHNGVEDVEKFNVVVVVPAYNEDPVTFEKMLYSLDEQTVKPDFLYIVDDGSLTNDCRKVFKSWKQQTTISARYRRQENKGKREAQALAFRNTKDADIYVTIDSDTTLDPKAIENGITPFLNPKVMSVAGLLVGLNYKANWLTRLTEIGFVSSFLNGRAAWSKLRSVAVNCGGLAFYRASVVRKYLKEYTTQTVFGKIARSGDDRIMTNYALLEGWAVYQENSVGYTLLPTKFKHLTKQRVRWWRSFFWGSVWLIGRFSPKRIVWWLVTWQLISFVLYTTVIPFALIIAPIAHAYLPLGFFIYLFILSYIRNARYLSLKRPDQPFYQQIISYLLSPVATILYFFLCTILQYVGLATVGNMGWSTRKKIEVGISKDEAAQPA